MPIKLETKTVSLLLTAYIRELSKRPDLDAPHTEREWHAAITVLHEALGVRGKLRDKSVFDVVVDVGKLG